MEDRNSYNWRPMRSEDVQVACVVLRENSTQITDEELEMLNDMSAENLLADTQIALTPSGKVAAAGFIYLFQSNEKSMTGLLEGAVDFTHRRQGLGRHLLSWQVERARQKSRQSAGNVPLTLRGSCTADNTQCIHLFENQGFVGLVTQYQMRFDLSQPIPTRSLPAGVTLTPYLFERDDEIRQVFNRAFIGHWIGELSSEKWKDRFIATPQFRPELTTLAAVDDQFVGFYLSEVFEDNPKQAWLEIVGVLPEWRSKGLGSALTTHALHTYKKAGFESCWLGVDEENITHAKQIYLSLGFITEKGTRYFVKTVE